MMKLNQIFLAIAILSLLAFSTKKNEVVITGKIVGNNISKIEYTTPVKGIFNGLMTDSIKPDISGNFQIVIPFEKFGFIVFRPVYKTKPEYKTQGFIIAEPGENYTVVIDSNKDNDNFQVSGKNEIAINQYNKIQNPLFQMIGSEIRPFRKDSVASSIHEKIQSQKEKEIAVFKEMYNKGQISGDFLQLVQIDRFCYYAEMTALLIQTKFNASSNPNAKFPKEMAEVYKYKDEMKGIWEEAFKTDYAPEELARSPWWFSYYKYYIYFKGYSNNELTQQTIKELNDKQLFKTFHVNNAAKKYLPASLFESYFANYIYSDCFLFREVQDFELVTLYDQFDHDYPNNTYAKYLTPWININKDYQRKINGSEYDKNVKFIVDYQNINNLRDCVKSFKGKKVYIDVWASWCGSCRAEFSKKEKLNELLKSKGIEMLYISMDEDKKEKNWKDLIKYYNLDGYHLRSNKLLSENIKKLQSSGEVFYIPWHIMIDENGNTMELPVDIADLVKENN